MKRTKSEPLDFQMGLEGIDGDALGDTADDERVVPFADKRSFGGSSCIPASSTT